MEQMRLLAAPSRIEKMNPYPTITSPSAHVPLYKLQTSNARPKLFMQDDASLKSSCHMNCAHQETLGARTYLGHPGSISSSVFSLRYCIFCYFC